jgi:pyruvate kinase
VFALFAVVYLNPKDVHKVKDMLARFGNDRIKVISKIERPIALGMA